MRKLISIFIYKIRNLYTTGINDECIIKWDFVEDNYFQDLDNLDYNIDYV